MRRPLGPAAAGELATIGIGRGEEHDLPAAAHEGIDEPRVVSLGQRRLPEHERHLFPGGGGDRCSRHAIDRRHGRLVGWNAGHELEALGGSRVAGSGLVIGHDERPPRRRLREYKIKLVVGGVRVGGNRHAAMPLRLRLGAE